MLCKTGSQQACVTVVTPMEIWSSYRCAVSQQKCSAALVWAKCISHCSVLLCKTGSQQACVTGVTRMEICSSYRCAVSQQKCSAALVWAKCSAALQNRLTASLCHGKYTYGDLLFIHVCSEPTEMQCSTGPGKMHFSLFSAALQNLHRCNCSDTSMLRACFAEQHWIVRNAFCQHQCCNALVMGHCTLV